MALYDGIANWTFPLHFPVVFSHRLFLTCLVSPSKWDELSQLCEEQNGGFAVEYNSFSC